MILWIVLRERGNSIMKVLALVTLVLVSSIQPLRAEPSNQADMEFMRMLQAKAAQSRYEEELKNPKKPEIQKGRAILGPSSAPVTIVAYSDFQCPYCKVGAERIEEVRKKYGNKVRFMFKHLPLSFHPYALPAAKRFEAINLQNGKKAYQFHDMVFKEQSRLNGEGENFLDDAAKKVGANVAKMKKDMEGDKVKRILDADQLEARSYGIDGTPGFIVGGVTLSGAQPLEAFSQIIDTKLPKRAVTSK